MFQSFALRPSVRTKASAMEEWSFSPEDITCRSDRNGYSALAVCSSSSRVKRVGCMTTAWIVSRAIVSEIYLCERRCAGDHFVC